MEWIISSMISETLIYCYHLSLSMAMIWVNRYECRRVSTIIACFQTTFGRAWLLVQGPTTPRFGPARLHVWVKSRTKHQGAGWVIADCAWVVRNSAVPSGYDRLQHQGESLNHFWHARIPDDDPNFNVFAWTCILPFWMLWNLLDQPLNHYSKLKASTFVQPFFTIT